jgi:hypothetical protein
MAIIEAKGHNGTVTFDGAFVAIQRKGALGRLTVGKGEKRIPVSSITAVQWKQPGALVNGYIAFTLAGGIESKARFGHQTSDAVQDENAVIVMKSQAAPFLELRDAVEAAIVAQHTPQAAAVPASGAVEVARLAELHASGILTDDEFAAAKTRALGL